MEKILETYVTCDNCARLFKETMRRYYCVHCDKYFYICPTCSENGAHCRYCGVPLKRSTEKRK